MMSHQHQLFNTHILPTVEGHARRRFGAAADPVAEAVALAWAWSRRLWERGKRPEAFGGAIAKFAVKAVRSGRRAAGTMRRRDAMNPIAQARVGFYVAKLLDFETLSDNPLAEALHDNTRTPPPDAAAFRIDWPRFLALQPERERRMAEQLASGEPANVVARRLGVSAGRLTQLRKRLRDRRREFHGDAA